MEDHPLSGFDHIDADLFTEMHLKKRSNLQHFKPIKLLHNRHWKNKIMNSSFLHKFCRHLLYISSTIKPSILFIYFAGSR